MNIAIPYNAPTLAADNHDAASEAGVLEAVEAVSNAMKRNGHRPLPFALTSPRQALEAVAAHRGCEVYFNLFEGFAGLGSGEAHVTSLLELTGKPVTGSPAESLALARDKTRVKWLLRGAGIATPAFCHVPPGMTPDRDTALALLESGPVIVKPAHEDASLGISDESVVESFDRLNDQLTHVHQRYGAALVEEFIPGREFNVSVLALPTPDVLPLAEIEFGATFAAGRQLVTYAAKWDPTSEQYQQTPVCCPANLPHGLATRIADAALAAFLRIGCRDYARVDLRVGAANRVYVLEVNANPDISPTAGFARALSAARIPYDQFVDRLIQNALDRNAQ